MPKWQLCDLIITRRLVRFKCFKKKSIIFAQSVLIHNQTKKKIFLCRNYVTITINYIKTTTTTAVEIYKEKKNKKNCS
jgi:hypothetical protein